MVDLTYSDKFTYTHDNPYHEKLSIFDDFVLRDHDAETKKGEWNTSIFNRPAPLKVEIGTGYGHFMMNYCQDHPDVNFIGMDYRFKRSFQLASKLQALEHRNFKYLRAKGERLHFMFSEGEVDEIFYFFPDPWPKTRHHKKRLFQQPFLEICHKVLRPGGKLMVKTDHDGYAAWMTNVIEKQNLFKVNMKTLNLREEFPTHFLAKYETKFEKIFLSQGIKIKAFELENTKGNECL